ncbi:MAG TPA: hypothetical protein VFS25_05300 [Chitinophaga sp.]|uniref:hypothetical protein n=1 Tax=Chitinophaga sp. TaxID=1869181 RepID=UPI002DB79EAB|nr:hypothetical protein [Chitinophaga sp.]HEU4552224.1 hypothetical protein [Chitinophaga sp.]
MLWHAVILLLAFTVRYTAVFYPCISVAAILITNTGLRNKLAGIAGILLLLVSFIVCTVWYYHKETGTLQYSAFGGWLVGSSALYGYAYANPDPVEDVPDRFRALHQLVNNHMDSIRHLQLRPDAEVGIYYFWDWKAPLMVYMNNEWSKDTTTGVLKRWASVSTLYADYGRYLISRHPWLFLQHYVWPNFIKYYAPPPKFMGGYNMGSENVATVIANWFQWKDTKIHTRYGNKEIHITKVFTILSAIVNLLFIVCFIGFIWLDGIRRCEPTSRRVLYWTLIVWIGNMVFSVVSAPIELRYQLFPLMITTVFLCLILYPIVMAGIYPQNAKWNTYFNLRTEHELTQVN